MRAIIVKHIQIVSNILVQTSAMSSLQQNKGGGQGNLRQPMFGLSGFLALSQICYMRPLASSCHV